jgi:ATP-dependent RNA helicase DDX55/SPB4
MDVGRTLEHGIRKNDARAGINYPLFMGNKDVDVEAVTGSGKTLTFLIPVVERLLRAPEQVKKNWVAVIVVSPTRYRTSFRCDGLRGWS